MRIGWEEAYRGRRIWGGEIGRGSGVCPFNVAFKNTTRFLDFETVNNGNWRLITEIKLWKGVLQNRDTQDDADKLMECNDDSALPNDLQAFGKLKW